MHYPSDPPGRALPLWIALWEGIKDRADSRDRLLFALPFLFVAGLGLVIMFLANAIF